MLGTENMSREYGPDYTSIIGIESRVRFSIITIREILEKLTRLKIETGIIRIGSDILKQFWKSPDRDEIVFSTSRFLGKNGSVPEELTIHLFNHIMRVTTLPDEDKNHTIGVIRETYNKIRNGIIVSGYDRFFEAVKKNQSIVNEIQSCFKQLGYFPEYHNGNNGSSVDTEVNDLVWIPNEVKEELKKHKWTLISHNPQKFMMAHSVFNQTLETRLQSKET
jgi:hypothetical protein